MVGVMALGASLEMLAQLGLTSAASPLADWVLEWNAFAARTVGRDRSRDQRVPCNPRTPRGSYPSICRVAISRPAAPVQVVRLA